MDSSTGIRRVLVFTMMVFVAVLVDADCRAVPSGRAAGSSAPLTAAEAYRGILHDWAAGDQAGAEGLLDTAIGTYPDDVRLTFFQAACTRSRFEVEDAKPIFRRVIDEDPNSLCGKAASLILALDDAAQASSLEAHFKSLDALSAAHPAEPILLWMVAVQCRALHKNEVGIARYDSLLTLINQGGSLPGPVLVHQTLANLLDDVGRSGDALPHREMAVKLEPEAWSYDGLGDTLTALRRWKEADAAYEKSTSLDPHDDMYWQNWVISMQARGDADGAGRVTRKANAAKR